MPRLGTKAIKRELCQDLVKAMRYRPDSPMGKAMEKDLAKLRVPTLVVMKNHFVSRKK